jgi:hypothetical protein
VLLIDGVKYDLWNPSNEDEFEREVKEHITEIFGEQCIYLDKKQKLKSLSGIGSIPDGLAIILGTQPELYIVEYELSNHDVYEHVVSQVSRFINGLLNSSTRQKIARIIYDEISVDPLLKIKVEQTLHSSEIFKFSTELLERKPILTIVIENKTEELSEALKPFSYQNIKAMKVVEFQTFTREGVGLSVHAHLFEPIYFRKAEFATTNVITETIKVRASKNATYGGIIKLIEDGNLKIDQSIWGNYQNARVGAAVTESGKIRLSNNGLEFSSLSMAAQEIVKYSINGWIWWKTLGNDGKEHTLDELRNTKLL